MLTQRILGLVPFVTILLTLVAIALANRKQKRAPWLRGATITEHDAKSLRASASNGVPNELVIEFVSENLPSSVPPFHEIMGTRFPSRWRSYLRVDLGFRPSCSFQIFERAALVKRPFFALQPVGAVWFPRYRHRLSIGDPRLDSRFELYAEDPARVSSVVAALATPLRTAPPFGLIEVVGSELSAYVSTIAAGLTGNSGAGLAAHVDLLRGLVADVASALQNAPQVDGSDGRGEERTENASSTSTSMTKRPST